MSNNDWKSIKNVSESQVQQIVDAFLSTNSELYFTPVESTCDYWGTIKSSNRYEHTVIMLVK